MSRPSQAWQGVCSDGAAFWCLVCLGKWVPRDVPAPPGLPVPGEGGRAVAPQLKQLAVWLAGCSVSPEGVRQEPST